MANLKLDNVIYSQKANEIFDASKKTLGFVPDMYVKMGANPALLDAYTYSYNSFRQNAGFNPVEQEVIFLSISYENSCEYCMAAHSFLADKVSNVPEEVTNAIREGKPIKDSKLAALSKLVRSLTANRGYVSQEEIEEFLGAGYTEAHVLGVIAAIAVKVMSNYANHNTNPVLESVFAGRSWKK